MDEALLAVVHLLVIGCWLGTDLAVFFLSGRVVDPAQPMSVRRFCANAMSWLDMLPRFNRSESTRRADAEPTELDSRCSAKRSCSVRFSAR